MSEKWLKETGFEKIKDVSVPYGPKSMVVSQITWSQGNFRHLMFLQLFSKYTILVATWKNHCFESISYSKSYLHFLLSSKFK